MESLHKLPLLCKNPEQRPVFLWINPNTLSCPTRLSKSLPLPLCLPQLPSCSLQFTGPGPNDSFLNVTSPFPLRASDLTVSSACNALLLAFACGWLTHHSGLCPKCNFWDSSLPLPSLTLLLMCISGYLPQIPTCTYSHAFSIVSSPLEC